MYWIFRIFGRLFSILFSRELWLFLAMLLVLALIWAYGPALDINGWRPLETRLWRYVLSGAIVLYWLVRLLRRWRWSQTAGAQVLERVRQPGRYKREPGAPREVAPDPLRAGFDDALRKLAAMPSEAHSAWGRLLDRISQQYRYRLPWFLVVGGPDAGKTSALLRAGIDLPDPDADPAGLFSDHAGDGDYAWLFSNQAVLIDAPGQAFDADGRADGEAGDGRWQQLQTLLRKYRSRQPLNGVVLTVSLPALLGLDERGRMRQAVLLHRRLLDLQARLAFRIPVYLLLTKLDGVQGFREYFDGLDRNAREQAWGFAFPTQLSPEQAIKRFDAEFGLLADRLHIGVHDVLEREPELDDRWAAYVFPQQFSTLGPVLKEFFARVFAASKFESGLWPRGVYFSSAAQHQAIIDRVSDPNLPGLVALPARTPRPGAGQGLFLKRFFSDVVFAESGLAGTHPSWRRRHLWGHVAACVLIAATLSLAVWGWTLSYRNNRGYLQEVAQRAGNFERTSPKRIALPSGAVQPLSPLLDTLLALPQSPGLDTAAPPLSYRFGLYQGARVQGAGDALYRRALVEKLLPQVAVRLRDILADAPAEDVEYSYQALKAYLMLYDGEHYDAAFLAAWLNWNIERNLPATITSEQIKTMEAHIGRLLEPGALRSPYPVDRGLVDATRMRITQVPISQRAYQRLRRKLLRTIEMDPITYVSTGGPQASLVFRRRSGRPLTEGIPGLYSYRGYWEVFNKQVSSATSDLEKDDAWVLGVRQLQGLDDIARRRLVGEVKREYFNDYVKVWDEYLDDLSLAGSESLAESIQIARVLSSPDSPLKLFLQSVARETQLLRGRIGDRRSLLGRAQEGISQAQQALTDVFGDALPTRRRPVETQRYLESIVDDHFDPLRRMVAGNAPDGSGPSALDGTLKTIDELYSYLNSTQSAQATGSPPPPPDVLSKLQSEAGRMPIPLRQMFDELSGITTRQVSGVGRSSLIGNAEASVGRQCRQIIQGRYPFVRDAEREVSAEDFARLFAPGGLMDAFYQKHLAERIDMSTQPWSFRDPGAGAEPMDAALPLAFQRAEVIRDVFFPSGERMPSVRLRLTPIDLDPSIEQYQLNIDGQTLRYAHGPPTPATMTWPGPRGSATAQLQLSPGTDAIRTEGTWALHRLFQRGQIKPGAAPEDFVVSYGFGGRKLSLRVNVSGSRNPFHLAELESFVCP